MVIYRKLSAHAVLAVLIVAGLPAFAQLDRVFSNIFNRILVEELQLSPGNHANHFIAAANRADQELTPALNSLIAGNISSFPLSATSSGVTFDFSSGQPVAVRESLGPIFGDTAVTLGKHRLDFGVNHTSLSLNKFRGLDTQDIRFTFTHVDISRDGTLGESPNESDTIDVFLDLDVDADITALYGTWGLTDNLDIGIAVPFVSVKMSGLTRARINSYTFAFLGMANHNFGSDPTHPTLETTVPYTESAEGIGDVSLRLKYGFLRSASVQLAFLVDIRFATGEASDFLGSGEPNIRLSEILSKKIGGFTGHVNLSYEKRDANFDSDELELNLGFDQQLGENITWAVDILADSDLNDDEAISLFPGTTRIVDHLAAEEGEVPGMVIRDVDLSNIPERKNDNTVNAAFGFRYAPTEHWGMLANMLVPLNDGGLRSDVVFTIGINGQF